MSRDVNAYCKKEIDWAGWSYIMVWESIAEQGSDTFNRQKQADAGNETVTGDLCRMRLNYKGMRVR